MALFLQQMRALILIFSGLLKVEEVELLELLLEWFTRHMKNKKITWAGILHIKHLLNLLNIYLNFGLNFWHILIQVNLIGEDTPTITSLKKDSHYKVTCCSLETNRMLKKQLIFLTFLLLQCREILQNLLKK